MDKEKMLELGDKVCVAIEELVKAIVENDDLLKDVLSEDFKKLTSSDDRFAIQERRGTIGLSKLRILL